MLCKISSLSSDQQLHCGLLSLERVQHQKQSTAFNVEYDNGVYSAKLLE